MKNVLLIFTTFLVMGSSAYGSGGSIYSNRLGFQVLHLDDGPTITFCNSLESMSAFLSNRAQAGQCLTLTRTSGNATVLTYNDPQGKCKVDAKIIEQAFETSDADEPNNLQMRVGIVKAKKGSEGCTLPYQGYKQIFQKSITGIYLPPQ